MKRSIIFLAALSVAVLLYGISTTEEFHKSYQLKKGEKIRLKNINGSIRIEGWKQDYVDVQATKKSSKGAEELEKVEIVVIEKNGLEIETRHLKRNPKVSVSYVLNVPKYVLLEDISSSNGSITFESAGVIENVNTSNGSIKLKDCSGNSDLKTSNGAITVQDHDGSISAGTSNGKIIAENISGLISTRTSNGSIKIFNVGALDFARTSNGSIKAQINSLAADATIKSSNGSIHVYLDETLNAAIAASTSNAGVKLHDLALTVNDISKHHLYGYLGDGGNLLKISTSNAKINLYSTSVIEK